MRTTEAELQTALNRRLSDLSEWLQGALEVGELRDKRSIRAAKNALLKWLCQGWDNEQGDVDGALESALECYVEIARRWVEEPATLEADLSISADPAWAIPEFHLIVASMLSEQALIALKRETKKGALLAAMLYADAVETREHWDAIRGPAGARNPDTWRGEMQKLLRELDDSIAVEKHRNTVSSDARKATSRKAAKARLANDRDGKQAAKAAIMDWWDYGRAIGPELRNGAAFDRAAVARYPVITDTGTVKKWREAQARSAKRRG